MHQAQSTKVSYEYDVAGKFKHFKASIAINDTAQASDTGSSVDPVHTHIYKQQCTSRNDQASSVHIHTHIKQRSRSVDQQMAVQPCAVCSIRADFY